MTPTVTLVRDGISSTLPLYAETMQKSSRQVLLRAFKGITRRVIALTPPANAGGGELVTSSEAFRAGKTKIANQMSYLMAPVKLKGRKTITQVFGRKLQTPVTFKTKERWPDVAGLYRANSRVAKGGFGIRVKVRRGGKFYVDARKFRQVLVAKQARVGVLAAGWAPAARFIGAPVPAWIARHGLGRGTVSSNLLSTSLFISTQNLAPGLPAPVRRELARRIPYAVAYQNSAMRREIDYMVRKNALQHGLTVPGGLPPIPAGMQGA